MTLTPTELRAWYLVLGISAILIAIALMYAYGWISTVRLYPDDIRDRKN